MVLKIRSNIALDSKHGWCRDRKVIMWNSIVFGFFFLDRSCELWEPVKRPRSNRLDNELDPDDHVHGLKIKDVRLIDNRAIEVPFRSSKADRTRQGTKIRLYRSGDIDLCPVQAFIDIKRARSNIESSGATLGLARRGLQRHRHQAHGPVSQLVFRRLHPHEAGHDQERIDSNGGGPCRVG